eukprot:gnl/TRDRNA2_/TRDRNA2_158752_c2_seq2.p1 gnl/TRDRNA2_/TRDRNA2_158752_c2~~gnl/TRDRNA2_/TRDRNA2_158752_c2_seq2.p1  ORF type:complete len:138 (-),score=25.41 gnl/TRDRNA2_/TRDRNA2_158752_c2_seq2:47-460(-)
MQIAMRSQVCLWRICSPSKACSSHVHSLQEDTILQEGDSGDSWCLFLKGECSSIQGMSSEQQEHSRYFEGDAASAVAKRAGVERSAGGRPPPWNVECIVGPPGQPPISSPSAAAQNGGLDTEEQGDDNGEPAEEIVN